MKLKTIYLSVILLVLVGSAAFAQNSKSKGKVRTENGHTKAFHIKQHVMVTMKDGTEVEAVVHSHMTRKKYWVRQWHSGREGAVKEKYMRALSESEITALKSAKKK